MNHLAPTCSADVRLFRTVGYVLVTLCAAVCLVPFIIIVSSSLTSEQSIIRGGYALWPREFSLEAYRTIFQNPLVIVRGYGVTILVAAVGTVCSVFLNVMTGYVLQRRDFRWRNVLSFYFFFTTLFSGGLVPWYILCVKYLGLRDNLLALIVPTLVSVWNILLVKGYMNGIPFEITESAKVDGANDFIIFVRLILPVAKPVVATVGLFTALTYWNDWFSCMLFINDEKLYSLQYLLYKLMGSIQAMRNIASQSGALVQSIPIESTKMALTVVVTGPIVLLYPFVQRFFVKGITLGAVKG